MSLRPLLAVIAALLVMFPLNGLFHSVLAAGFFDRELAALAPAIRPMKEANPLFVLLLDATIAAAIVALLARQPSPTARQGASVGALANLLTSSAWNLANAASLVTWSATAAVADIAWHVALGAAAGALAATVLRGRRRALPA